jgi:hypothetical protein
MVLPTRRQIVKACRDFEPTWRYVFNLAPTLAYQFGKQTLSGEAARVLADLNRDGVAITSVSRLFGQNPHYDELSSAVDKLEKVELADQLAALRESSDEKSAIGQKTFIFPLLGERPLLDADTIYARFGLQQPVLHIANAYFGMYTRLRYYNVWHTFATQSDARESQLWHRDREDHLVLKMFVYLSDVDEGAGPFTYAPGSHPKGRLRREPEHFMEGNVRRSNDEQMAEAISRERWLPCVGPKGTIVFADTRGYHRGGLARERDRLMYTCMFTSPASQSEEFFRRTAPVAPPTSKELAFALAGPRPGPWLSSRV